MEAGAAFRGRYLVFHLEDRAYCIPTAAVEEIVPMAELSTVPSPPTFLAGFLDVAGQLVAVISLRRLLRMPDRERELYTPLVILKLDDRLVAFEVDCVKRIVEFAEDDLIPVAEGCSLNNCATAVARLDGNSVVLLSPDRILLHEERHRILELARLADERRAVAEVVSE